MTSRILTNAHTRKWVFHIRSQPYPMGISWRLWDPLTELCACWLVVERVFTESTYFSWLVNNQLYLRIIIWFLDVSFLASTTIWLSMGITLFAVIKRIFPLYRNFNRAKIWQPALENWSPPFFLRARGAENGHFADRLRVGLWALHSRITLRFGIRRFLSVITRSPRNRMLTRMYYYVAHT